MTTHPTSPDMLVQASTREAINLQSGSGVESRPSPTHDGSRLEARA